MCQQHRQQEHRFYMTHPPVHYGMTRCVIVCVDVKIAFVTFLFYLGESQSPFWFHFNMSTVSVGKHAVWEIYLYSVRQSFDSKASIMHEYTIVNHCCYVMYLSADLIIYKYRDVRDIFRYIHLASLQTHCITLGHGEGMIGGGTRFIFKRSYVKAELEAIECTVIIPERDNSVFTLFKRPIVARPKRPKTWQCYVLWYSYLWVS